MLAALHFCYVAGTANGLFPAPLGGVPWAPCRSQDGLARVVAQAGQRARLADVQDLPAVVHQLLMLSTRGCRDVVLTVGGGEAWLEGLATQTWLAGAWHIAQPNVHEV